ncbi:DUF4893 domain-containing protein [Paracoccus sp. (in: a-proteobacteria)]|uniref:DUF4893 domain-containing protein n=1 Tax=Paracoccus sp. TaxID=267 RepID=UPI00396C91B0
MATCRWWFIGPFRAASLNGQFEKRTGSQRMTGTLGMLDGQPVYVGTAYVTGETPYPYADLPPETDPSATPQMIPEIEVTGSDTARLLLPLPLLESELNVLLLTR